MGDNWLQHTTVMEPVRAAKCSRTVKDTVEDPWDDNDEFPASVLEDIDHIISTQQQLAQPPAEGTANKQTSSAKEFSQVMTAKLTCKEEENLSLKREVCCSSANALSLTFAKFLRWM